jgi:hypothetical protein
LLFVSDDVSVWYDEAFANFVHRPSSGPDTSMNKCCGTDQILRALGLNTPVSILALREDIE